MIYIYLALTLIVSIVGSITDLKTGKVKNQHLIIAFIIWIICFSIEASITGWENKLPSLYLIINFILSLLLSLFFYFTDIWAPGDIKIFLLIVLIYPFSCYHCKPGNIFPSLDIVIFAFAAGYFYLLGKALLSHQAKKPDEKYIVFTKQKFLSFITNIGCCCILHLVSSHVVPVFYDANRAFFVLISVGLIYFFDKYYHKLKLAVGLVLFVIYVAIIAFAGHFQEQILTLIENFLICAVITELDNIIGKTSYKEINGSEVRPGIILSYMSVLAMQKCIDPDIPRTTTESRRSRLNVVQATAVQRWCKNAKRSITIVEMLPFVPLFTISIIIQIIRYFVYQ